MAGSRRRYRILLLAWTLCAFTFLDDVARRVEEGNRHFDQAEFDAALEKYREAQTDRPDAPELHFNVGDALYKQGAVQEAMAAFQKAVESGDPDLAASAYYNVGNAAYRQQLYDLAVDAYEKSLELNPDDRDAKVNLEMALEKLQQQEQQQQQQDQQGDGDDENKDQQNQQQNQDQQDEQDRSEQENRSDQDREGDREEQQNESQSNPGDENRPPEQQQEGEGGQPGELTPEEAERLLDALKDRETESQKRRRVMLQGKRYRGNPW